MLIVFCVPFSRIWKSSFVRPWMRLPFLSVTTTSTLMTRTSMFSTSFGASAGAFCLGVSGAKAAVARMSVAAATVRRVIVNEFLRARTRTRRLETGAPRENFHENARASSIGKARSAGVRQDGGRRQRLRRDRQPPGARRRPVRAHQAHLYAASLGRRRRADSRRAFAARDVPHALLQPGRRPRGLLRERDALRGALRLCERDRAEADDDRDGRGRGRRRGGGWRGGDAEPAAAARVCGRAAAARRRADDPRELDPRRRASLFRLRPR